MPLPAGHPPFSSFSAFHGVRAEKPLFYWLESRFVIFAIFVKKPLFLAGQKHGLPKAPFSGPRDFKEPRGPKDQKNSRFRSRLKISIETEIFERATHRGPIFVGGGGGGNRDIEIKIFERDQKFRSRLKISIDIKFFWSLGPLGILTGL